MWCGEKLDVTFMTRVQNKCKKTKYKYSENKVKKITRGQNPQTLPSPRAGGRGTQHGSHAGVFGTRPAGSHGRICNDNRKESGCHPGAGAVTHHYITSGTWPLAPRIEDRGGGPCTRSLWEAQTLALAETLFTFREVTFTQSSPVFLG